MLLTLIALPEYQKQAGKLFSDEERAELLVHLATHPKAGDLIAGAGGAGRVPVWTRVAAPG